MHVEYPSSKLLGTRSVSDFFAFLIFEYLYYICWLSILNSKIQSLSCSNERFVERHVSTQKLWISEFLVRETHPVWVLDCRRSSGPEVG